jgi:tetratricopeptide (TPR) repeat protein
MSDPLTIDPSRALDASSVADRDAKIEQLLLAGLDHYFAAEYEQAVNVWSRALFLDRTHARARAYIERARSALAERQRASEELLQHGVAAFQRGEAGEARRLLQQAIAGGAPADEALAVLDRLDRLDAAVSALPERALRPLTMPMPGGRTGRARAWLVGAAALLTLGVALAVAYEIEWRSGADWRSLVGSVAPSPGAAGSAIEPPREHMLPLPQRAETALARARALDATGRLRDALAALDAVRATDAQRGAADRLRSDIERRLLELGAARRQP